MPYEIENAAFRSDMGKVNGPIFCATTNCWHLLWIVSRSDPAKEEAEEKAKKKRGGGTEAKVTKEDKKIK